MSDEFTERKGGYDRLASLMGEVPDTAIFKKFGALSAEILLYRQAELTLLEDELRDQQKEDRNSPQEVRTLYARSFGKLRNSAASDAGEDDDDNQWNLIQQIEEKLEKYHNGLLLHNRVLKLRRPYKGQLENLKQWMKRPKMGNISILSADRKIWSDSDLQDLVTLKPESVEDGFASSFTLKLVSIYNSLIGRRVHKQEKKDFLRNTIVYRDEGIFRILRILVILVACLLPVAAISGLSSIESMPSRLGAVGVFTTVFTVVVALTTKASLQDVFTATAAFAAVLVVFIGTNGTSCAATSAQ